MEKRDEIIAGAMGVFELQGFRGIGVDAVLAPSGASTRTLYKHFGSRDGLVLAVVERRHQAFMRALARLPDHGIEPLFQALADWLVDHGAHGCMLLRARAEYAAANDAVAALVARQKAEFRDEIARRVRTCLGRPDEMLTTQLWLLFEGATAAAAVAGPSVIDAALSAAQALLSRAASEPS